MEEQTAALLAALKKQASTNVDKRLDLFSSLKSSIKHQRVPESCQAQILECIRIAISAQTSAQLVTTGFSTLSHLVKRLVLQKETHIISTPRNYVPYCWTTWATRAKPTAARPRCCLWSSTTGATLRLTPASTAQ